jgi:CBS domain-containing protein
MILKVRHAMKPNPAVVDSETMVTDAACKMIQAGQDTLIVQDGDNIRGTVDLRNLVRYTYTQGFRPHQTPISEITNCDIILARPNTSLEDCLTIMTELKQDTLPVVDGKLVGSINIHDLLKAQPQTKPHVVMPEIA